MVEGNWRSLARSISLSPLKFYILTTIPVSHFGIGIDTARYGHHVSFMDEYQPTATKLFHFEEHAQGYQKLLKALLALAAKAGTYHFNIRIDAAGQYADNFIHWLHSQKLKSKRPPLNFAAFKSQLSIAEVLRSHNWKERTSRGQQLRGPCPIHKGDETDRSFAVHVGQNTYCCHSCQSKGNALDLLVALSDQSLHEAAWEWIDKTGISAQLVGQKREDSIPNRSSAKKPSPLFGTGKNRPWSSEVYRFTYLPN